ncbi:MAG: hypothetical protein HWN65_12210 [Candidatus Helarchaeota archaeon]|nr:hypothetical protein [Candidatus Helarchaeota archaeon]
MEDRDLVSAGISILYVSLAAYMVLDFFIPTYVVSPGMGHGPYTYNTATLYSIVQVPLYLVSAYFFLRFVYGKATQNMLFLGLALNYAAFMCFLFTFASDSRFLLGDPTFTFLPTYYVWIGISIGLFLLGFSFLARSRNLDIIAAAKDRTTVVFGIIYTSMIPFILLFLFIPFPYTLEEFSSYVNFGMTPPGYIFLTGCVFLVASLIGNILFLASTERTGSGKIGFRLGLLGSIICIIGSVIAMTYNSPVAFLPVIILITMIFLIISGSLLYSRVFKVEYTDETAFEIQTTQTPRVSIHQSGPRCLQCYSNTRYIPEEARYYCDHCQKYIE